ncbi:matrixin family metalloprotease [Streptomyces sp. NPDC088360]|uniref:matrixin family metalloprotease n=1 Tax=Streptomyces sp. NPDC088360 TaxID=3154515 RepID=UPI0034511158
MREGFGQGLGEGVVVAGEQAVEEGGGWSDVTTSRPPWKNILGLWKGLEGTDMLRLNKAYLGAGKQYGDTRSRQTIAAHELGHALGFCHKNPSPYGSLMAPHLYDMSSNAEPMSRDRRNYHALWG